MSASVQAFPKDDMLAANLNLIHSELVNRIGKTEGAAYSYIVKTVRMDRTSLCFEQHGSAPNFQGGHLTLCTCKHQMRSSLEMSAWKNKWVAGFTSRCLYQKRHWMFFLTLVQDAHKSHAELWECLPSAVREAKSAQEHFLGDLFAPRGSLAGEDRFDPRRYLAPSRHIHHSHKCDNDWHNDINYKHSDRYRRPSLLVGDPHLTFLWEKPVIFFDEDHCRNFKKWESVSELLPHLKCEGP